MFPVLLRARGSMQWFAWRSVDDPDGAIVREIDRLFVASSLPALIERWRARDPDAPVDESVLSIDLDALIAELRRGARPDDDTLLNALNVLDDIACACRAIGRDAAFGGIETRLSLYKIVFSRTQAGRIAKVSRRPMSEADRGAIADWLEAGADMVCAAMT
ncbi:MAG: hypothetical protein IT473_04035 [Lysobacter sp.]|nr:hypothetical protein [Lysobacter sp.]